MAEKQDTPVQKKVTRKKADEIAALKASVAELAAAIGVYRAVDWQSYQSSTADSIE